MDAESDVPWLIDRAAQRLAEGARLLIWGPLGAGKTTLAELLARRMEAAGRPCRAIAADPGSPGFGPPGALTLASRREDGWQVEQIEALCALDAARYRLPLVHALGRLAGATADGALMVDAPGVARGAAGAELLLAMAEAVRADLVVALVPESGTESDAARTALAMIGLEVLQAVPAPEARRRSKPERARARTDAWNRWLTEGRDERLDTASLRLLGIPPASADDWTGRQVALLDPTGDTIALGEARAMVDGVLQATLVRTGPPAAVPDALLLRDAARAADGLLGTRRTVSRTAPAPGLPPELADSRGPAPDPALFVHLGAVSGLLPGGLFGDPLLHLRLRQRAQSLLFDLGDSVRLPAKVAHQVSDVFITHAHMDHIAGFLGFLRVRIGLTGTCRLFGPPGLAGHVAGFIAGVHWDRIGDNGPRFEIQEIHGDRRHCFRIRVGGSLKAVGEGDIDAGRLTEDAGWSVRAVTLDHGIPVLAYAFETAPTLHIRSERLAAAGLSEGPWVGELKRRLLAGEEAARVPLPDGRSVPAGELAAELVERRAARRLVYATDLADTPENRSRLGELARGADVLICEAGFIEADAAQARRTGHLTARACGEIAAAAGVARLIPFHFSRRYEQDPTRVYDEVEAAFGAMVARAGQTEFP